MRRLVAVGCAAFILAGCASSMDTYSRQDLGRIIETTSGTVVSSRPVSVSGTRSGMGALAGGATGGVVGATTIGSGSGSAIAGVLLGIAGAVVGGLAEEALTSSRGYEYTIATDDGRVVTIVQTREGDTPPISNGTPVRVQWGSEYARVIPEAGAPPPPVMGAPTPVPAPAGDPWINPDDTMEPAPPQAGVRSVAAPAGTTEDLNRRQLQRPGGSAATPSPWAPEEPAAVPQTRY